MLNFKVDETLCTRCKACVHDCPARVIEMPEGQVPVLTAQAETQCIQCQHCLAICPVGAISILGKNPEDSVSLDPSRRPSIEAMEMLVRGRRTVRRYKPENVSADIIQRLLDNTAYAPTGANRRTLTFTVIDDQEVMQTTRQHVLEGVRSAIEAGRVPDDLAYLHIAVPAFFKHGADLMFRGAPHLLIVSAGPDALCPNEDVVIALSTFEMLAVSAGLGTTWCGMLKMALESVSELKERFGLPADHTYYAMLFGVPNVTYARTVQREGSATVHRLSADG